jgi:nucleoside-diphosphate-sugar epimerase
MVPSAAEWIHPAKTSVVMDTSRAKDILGWRPQHSASETLAEMSAAL